MKSGPGSKRRWACAALWLAMVSVGMAPARAAPTGFDDARLLAGPTDAQVLYLFQRIGSGPAKRPRSLAIDFAPSAWRAGSPDGATATEAQLRAVLDGLQPIVVTGGCRGAGTSGALARPCAFVLGRPDFAGIVNPDFDGQVFGWAASAPARRPGARDDGSAALGYFGLLAPMRQGGPGKAASVVALRFRISGAIGAPPGFEHGAATVIVHNDRLLPLVLRSPAGHEALMRRIASLAPLPHEPAASGATEMVLK